MLLWDRLFHHSGLIFSVRVRQRNEGAEERDTERAGVGGEQRGGGGGENATEMESVSPDRGSTLYFQLPHN